jgi:hypothetical protein
MTINLNFFNLLTLVFVAAKLFNVIDWSWWLVFSPTLFTIAVLLLIAGLVWYVKD